MQKDGETMRKIAAGLFISLDGVAELRYAREDR